MYKKFELKLPKMQFLMFNAPNTRRIFASDFEDDGYPRLASLKNSAT